MNTVLEEMLATRQGQLPDGTRIPLHSEISEAEGAMLQRLIRERRPRVTLEIGCAFGVSSLYICEALAEVGGSKHIIIDPDQRGDWRSAGLYALERAGYASLVEFIPEPSHRALPALAARGERIGFGFVDGFHTFDYVMVDFFYIDLMLEMNGIVMLDDTSYPAIRKVARYIATHRHYEPLAGGGEASVSRPRRGLLRTAMVTPPFSRLTSRLLRSEVVLPDAQLGLPRDNFIAFRKLAEDEPGHATRGNRRFDQHHDF